MAIVPKPLVKRVRFYATRLPSFAAHAAQIGTTPESVADLQDEVDAAWAAYSAQGKARLAARSATLAFNLAVRAVNQKGSAIILQVRARAAATGDDSIYTLALLSPRADKSPLGPPGTPNRFSTTLDGNGTLTLHWTCKHPRGAQATLYRVYRSVQGRGEFAFLGSTGKKRFVDKTIPAGVTTLTYRIQAVRTTKVGVAAEFNVSFGSNAASLTLGPPNTPPSPHPATAA